ncbi:MAG: 60S ribosomal export protein NMD3 [Acidilobaceae archaeon]|nr:60S ribosomal export protein NMD3 [Acidilobaceae archaeon]MDW7973886.1 60S ribosomal export protein NMD3 [Sulfolobales archaeon]
MGRICPRCGSERGPFIGPLCSRCFSEVYRVAELPEELELRYCRSCGAYKLLGEWVSGPGEEGEAVREYAILVLGQKAKPSVHLDEVSVRDAVTRYEGHGAYTVLVKVRGRRGDAEVEEERKVRVKVLAQLCPSCLKRKSGTGHQAVIQIRPLIGRLSEEYRREIEALLGTSEERLRSAVISLETLKEGIDVTVEDQSAARILANKIKGRFGGFVSESFKLKSIRGGERRGVLSISTRIVNAEPGSLLAYGSQRVLFAGIGRGRVILLDAYSGEVMERDLEEVSKYKFAEESPPGELMRLRYLGEGEGELLFQDEEGRVLEFSREAVRMISGRLRQGQNYMAYLLENALYLMGEGFEG